jgi:lipoprotein-anchoring transpeptidase ErfK/SrfK
MRPAGRLLVVLLAFLAIATARVEADDAELSVAPEQATQQTSQQAQEQASAKTSEQASEQKSEQSSEQKGEPGVEQATQQAGEPKPERAAEQSSEQTPAPAPKADLSPYAPGTIVVETSERRLHLVVGEGEVLSYPVGVGKRGKSWTGTGAITGKFLRPPWSPPRRLKMEKPWTPDYIPGGSPSNPMGAAAMTLNVDQYAIHGTNDSRSIGGFVSFGCIRMHNRDILDLYKRVKVGTKVVVLQ